LFKKTDTAVKLSTPRLYLFYSSNRYHN
jgi:hypothetical protein